MNQSSNHLLILSEDAKAYEKILKEKNLSGLTITTCENASEVSTNAQGANIIFGDPDLIKAVLPGMTRLEWVQSTWAGVTPLMGEGTRKDYTLTGVKGVFGPIMSEYVLCYMLMHERGALKRYASQRSKGWNPAKPGRLGRKKIGIMGMGSIGSSVAKTARFFDMEVRGYSRRKSSCKYIHQGFLPGQLMDFVRDLDYLVSVMPDTPDTRNILGKDVFEAMSSRSVLINVGRGNAIHEPALVAALKRGEIAGAVLDVFKQEPLPDAHPFWTTPGVIITSHTAALSYPEDITPLFVDNYTRFLEKNPLEFQVDFKQGY